MTLCSFTDRAVLSGPQITSDGYMAASVRCARTGIQDYRGAEFDMPEREVLRVYRPPAEVFAKKSLATFAHRPVTNDHPAEMVNANNWRTHSVGAIGDEVAVDGEFVRVSILLMDGAAIRDVQAGKSELSMGYTSELKVLDAPEMTPGDNPQPYDAVMTDLRMNHLAIVDKGRAGAQVRIGDAWSNKGDDASAPNKTDDASAPSTINKGSEMATRKIMVDGMPVETTDDGATVIEKLVTDRDKAVADAATAAAAHATELSTKAAEHSTALATKDSEAAAKDNEIKELKSKIVTGAALDALVRARSALMDKAAKHLPEGTLATLVDGSETDIKRAALDAAHGPAFAKDKDDTYVSVAFDLLPEPTEDGVVGALKGRTTADGAVGANDNGQSAYERGLADGWKTGNAGGDK